MMSLHRLSAGAGYQYLLRHTACGDVHRASSTPLTAYYTESGYPPGRWLGNGLGGIGLRADATVGEPQMALLYGAGRDPLSGQPLGRAYPSFVSLADRINRQVEALPDTLEAEQREDLIAQIRARESARPSPCAVAGFDLTFTVPKSASVLWALADPATQEAIAAAHRAALEEALAFFEARALFTRTGSAGCAQVPTRGMVATAFDHWDTRTGDPNLHTHVVVANKVQGADGKWRSLDSRALHHATVAVSELYDTVFADELSNRLPVGWSWRQRGERRSPAFEVDGISDDLLRCFSTRSAQVEQAMTELLRTFQAEHGRGPKRVEVLQLRQRATRATRPAKTLRPLPELMNRWREQARHHTGADPGKTATAALNCGRRPLTREDIPDASLHQLTERTLEAIVQRRSTWTPWNVISEACRTTRGLRLASVEDRTRLLDDLVSEVLERCEPLDPQDGVRLPQAYQREDGTSVFSRAGERQYSHRLVLDAEQRLLDANTNSGARTVAEHVARRLATTPQQRLGQTYRLAADQIDAVLAIATSGRPLDVLVGPAGTGKTTTLRALRAAWETAHGRGSVIGLAPSSAAAHELAEALSIPCENTAKWIYETDGTGGRQRRETLQTLTTATLPASGSAQARTIAVRHATLLAEQQHWQLRPEQLVIVDEASLAGTFTLDQLRAQAAAAGAKLLLVGDHRQLSAVDAGGAFGLLAETGAAHELRSLWRFRHRWEAAATRQLRRGDHLVLEEYAIHDRIRSGTAEVAVEDAYLGWQDSERRGDAAILVAADSRTVDALNQRAHQDRVTVGLVRPDGISLGPDEARGRAGVGDRVLTRRNSRRLPVPGRGHVRNGALWTVIATRTDGSLLVTPADRHVTHDCHPDPTVQVLLPASYVTEHVDLGYATTAHRAQGLTVEDCHVLVTGAMSREALYVAMTRGRAGNTAYVATDAIDPLCEEIPDTHAVRTARQVLEAVLDRSSSELSATQTRDRLVLDATSIKTLQPIRETLISDADLRRWEPCIEACMTADQAAAVMSSPARGALFAALRRGDAAGLPMLRALQEITQARSLDNAQDIAAVLHQRIEHWVTAQAGTGNPGGVATVQDDIERAITELDDLINKQLAQLSQVHTRAADEQDESLWQALLEQNPPVIER